VVPQRLFKNFRCEPSNVATMVCFCTNRFGPDKENDKYFDAAAGPKEQSLLYVCMYMYVCMRVLVQKHLCYLQK